VRLLSSLYGRQRAPVTREGVSNAAGTEGNFYIASRSMNDCGERLAQSKAIMNPAQLAEPAGRPRPIDRCGSGCSRRIAASGGLQDRGPLAADIGV